MIIFQQDLMGLKEIKKKICNKKQEILPIINNLLRILMILMNAINKHLNGHPILRIKTLIRKKILSL